MEYSRQASEQSQNQTSNFTLKIPIPQPQFHRRGSVALAQPMLVEQNHYRCQMASEYSQEDQHSGNLTHDPPTSREESIQWETIDEPKTRIL